jgi:dGTPase
MANFGGFNHNDQSLRVVTHLEHRYAAFNGLNLSWEVLEGIAKHNGPVVAGADMPTTAEIDAKLNLRLTDYAPLEAQIAAIADDIAYNCHDLDDGLRAKCFSLDDVAQLPLLGNILAELRQQYAGLEPRRLGHEMVRRLMRLLVADVLAHTNQNLVALNPQSADDVRGAGVVTVWFSPNMWAAIKTLKAFLMQNMYRHYKVSRMNRKMGKVVQDLFEHFMAYPETLPSAWQLPQNVGQGVLARQGLDYVAGTTDRFALEEHKALLG